MSGCKKGKCFIKGIVAIILIAVISFMIGGYFWMDLYKDVWSAPEFSHLWRDHNDPQWLKILPIPHVIYAIAFVMGYCKFASGLKCPLGTKLGGGVIFGLYVWIFTGVNPTLWSYIVYPVSFDVASIIAKEMLLINAIAGIISAALIGKKTCSASGQEGESCSSSE